MLVNNKIIKSGGIILAGVINSIYQKKLKLFINPLGQKTMGLPMDECTGGDMIK